MSTKKEGKGEMPVCPYCNKVLKPVEYCGYYEGFHYWECECETLPNSEQWSGFH